MRRPVLFLTVLLSACAATPPSPTRAPLEPISWPDDSSAARLALLNRVSWGANRSSFERISKLGAGRWLDAQLHPQPARLPPDAQATIDAMTITQRPIASLVAELEQKRRAFQSAGPEDRKAVAHSLGAQQDSEARAMALLVDPKMIDG